MKKLLVGLALVGMAVAGSMALTSVSGQPQANACTGTYCP